MLQPLTDRADPEALKKAIASGVRPESLRKALFRMFSTMRIKDPATKKELISELMECTPSEDERKDLERILKMETAPAEHRMLLFAYQGATIVLFEYAIRKLISMQDLAGMCAAEREYFEDVLSSLVEMASKDKRQFKAARSVFAGITNNGASPEVRDLVGDALAKLNMYDFTAPFAFDPNKKSFVPGQIAQRI